MTAVSNFVRGVIGLFAAVLFIGMLAINPIFTGWLGGAVTAAHIRDSGVSEVREKYFRVTCTDYFEASLIERWTTPDLFNSGWCEDYKDRL
jgi:hypothetical protein